MFVESGRKTIIDKKVDKNLSENELQNRLFIRLIAKEKEFTKVDFKYCIFDQAYLRKCIFDSCDFTGCHFVKSNLIGSIFDGCIFDYVTFEKTQVDVDILHSSCPGPENLKQKFARTLRMNYQSVGEARNANLAVAIELEATKEHLYKSWKSKESYYRKKYKGFNRIKAFWEWIEFKVLDYIWGNGESAIKLLRTALIALFFIAIIDTLFFKDPKFVKSYFMSLLLAPQLLMGLTTPSDYPGLYLSSIFLIRLILFGFFMSIIIKRFNRR